jgi:molybdopterin-guanine dinucleotide biosynthesis protein A
VTDRIERANLLGCVLAGGLSRRMGGGDKALLQLDDKPLIGHVVGRLAGQVGATIVNANGDPARFGGLCLPVVPDTIEGHPGPLAGILAGMRHAHALGRGFSHIVSAAADTPFLPSDLAARLAGASRSSGTIVLAASGGRVHPVFGLWPVSLADDLQAWLAASEGRSVQAFTESRSAATVAFDTVAIGRARVDPFMNINTPEDLASARRILLPQR